jgi:rare lipoprotein A (peptidoglycan hydrolase)
MKINSVFSASGYYSSEDWIFITLPQSNRFKKVFFFSTTILRDRFRFIDHFSTPCYNKLCNYVKLASLDYCALMIFRQLLIITVIASIALTGCARNLSTIKQSQNQSYTVMGKTYYPMKEAKPGLCQSGIASWYGPGFHGKKTASTEIYNMHELTAAHNVLPLNTLVKITNLENQKEVVVRINDRGPFVGDRIVDLSWAAAKKLGMVKKGTVPVRVAVLGPANGFSMSKWRRATEKADFPAPNPFYVPRSKGLLAFVKD